MAEFSATTKTLFTSYYASFGSHPDGYSISLNPPRWLPTIKHIPQLAPTWKIIIDYKTTRSQAMYVGNYLDLLWKRNLTPAKIVDLVPNNAILLCYEKSTDFCHRHVLANHLRTAGVATISELPSLKQLKKAAIAAEQPQLPL